MSVKPTKKKAPPAAVVAMFRNAVVVEGARQTGVSFSTAKEMIADFSPETIAEVIESTMESFPGVTMAAPAGGRITDFIKNMDPEVKKAIIAALLKVLGFVI